MPLLHAVAALVATAMGMREGTHPTLQTRASAIVTGQVGMGS